MANEDTEQSPWTRPGFVAAAIVVALVLILAAVLGVGALRDNDEDPPGPTATATATATAEPSPSQTADASGEGSVCGLEGVEIDGAVTAAVPATWEYQGTTAYPSSKEFGPGATDAAGVRHCFQHSPEGALVAAANALVQAADPAVSRAWAAYFVSSGPNREALLAEAQAGAASSADVRMNIAGFRVLNYTGQAATVDIAVQGSADGTPVVGSFVYDLVWDAGDWKLDASSPEPFGFAAIPDLAGYIAWGA